MKNKHDIPSLALDRGIKRQGAPVKGSPSGRLPGDQNNSYAPVERQARLSRGCSIKLAACKRLVPGTLRVMLVGRSLGSKRSFYIGSSGVNWRFEMNIGTASYISVDV